MFDKVSRTQLSRRQFVKSSAATAVVSSVPVLNVWGMGDDSRQARRGPSFCTISLDQDWLSGGKLHPAALQPGFDDASFSKITLPHCVTRLSWQNWDPSTWEDVWIYRRHFKMPAELRGLRSFLHFDRVMEGTGPVLNGSSLPQHLGGFLPFKYEVTNLLKEENVLSVAVDSRWLNVPPSGSPRGPRSVDYLLPGGISGPASLRMVPATFISDVFAKPVSVLDSKRRLEITCRIDAAARFPVPVRVEATLFDGRRRVARASESAMVEKADQEVKLTLSDSTRVAFGAADKFGVQRPFVDGNVSLTIHGPGVIVGDNSFQLRDSGGVGAVWIKTLPGRAGEICIEARHHVLGRKSVTIRTVSPNSRP